MIVVNSDTVGWMPVTVYSMSMVDSTKVLCPLVDKFEILILGEHFPISGQNVEILIIIEKIKIKIKLEWIHKGVMCITLFHEGFKSSH